MDSAIIETVGCPLDLDLLKSWEHFSLESSYNSDDSELTDEETKIKQDELIGLLKDFSINDETNSKCIPNEIIKINSQNKNNSETSFTTNDVYEEKRSLFLLKNEDLINCEKEADFKSKFSKHSNKNNVASFQEENVTNKTSSINYTENDEKMCPSLSHKNNKLSNHKSDSDSSAGSDSDDDEQSASVIIRERYPKRHNRPENNKELRPTPFPQNHTKTFKQHLKADYSQASLDTNPVPYNLNIFRNDCDSLNNSNSTNFGTYDVFPSNGTFNSCLSCPEFVSDDAFFSSLMTDQIVTDAILNEVTNQIVNDVVPCKSTNKINNGVFPCTLVDDLFDSVVPSPNDIGNVNDISFAENNKTQYCNNTEEKYFFESVDTGFVASNIGEKIVLNSHDEYLSSEELEQILKEFTDLKSDNPSNKNCVNLSEKSSLHALSIKEVENALNNSLKFNEDINVCTFKEMSCLDSSQHHFDKEYECMHSFSSKENAQKISLCSNFSEESNTFEKSSEYDNRFCVNKPGNYSNLISMNVTSINSECLSPKTSNFMSVSEEIEHEIMKFKEFERIMKEQKNPSEITDPLPDIGWNMFPFVGVDDSLISDWLNKSPNITQNKSSCEKNDSKNMNINQTHKSICKTELPKICPIIKTDARDKLFQSSSFCIAKWERENEKMRQQINIGMLGTEKKKVIHFLNKNRETKYKGTNLHRAISSGNIEQVFCIVECHKECHETAATEINLRDSSLKTVLDYSKEKGLDLLTDYLRENNATESVIVSLRDHAHMHT